MGHSPAYQGAIAVATFQDTEEATSGKTVCKPASVASELIVKRCRHSAFMALHWLVFMFVCIETCTVWENSKSIYWEGMILVKYERACLMKTKTSSLVPLVLCIKFSAFWKSWEYRGLYNFSQNSSFDLYVCRCMFSTCCPCGPCIETEAACTNSSFPSC